MKAKISLLAMLFLISCITLSLSQEIHRNVFRLPQTVSGYHVLKCDFHLHTVFSDGSVWPVVRVEEAFAEGLDVIAITDHVEYRPRIKEMGAKDSEVSYNAPYNLAKSAAAKYGVILIPGVEITKEVPPGHFNALFIKDADPFGKNFDPGNPTRGSFIRGSLGEARKQDAFIVWNHPWFRTHNNTSIWFPLIDSLYNEGYINGVEVVNSRRYDPVIFRWVLDKNLTNLANSDTHNPTTLNRTLPRTMTIVFAKERTSESIKEALKEKRTISYCNDSLYGDSELLEALFHKSIEIKTYFSGKNGYISFSNNTSLPFEIKFSDTGRIKISTYSGGIAIPAKGEAAVLISNDSIFESSKEYIIGIRIMNLETAPGVPLTTELVARCPQVKDSL